MASKLEAARLATTAGENVIIASGRVPDSCPRSSPASRSARSSWPRANPSPLGNDGSALRSSPAAGCVLDAGAQEAIQRKGRSLLAAGIVEVDGNFAKGDVVALRGPDGTEFARGLTNYGHEDLPEIKGLRTSQIAAC